MKTTCLFCGRVYRWRPSTPCLHLVAARWNIRDFLHHQIRVRRTWLHPAATGSDLEPWLIDVLKRVAKHGFALPRNQVEMVSLAQLQMGGMCRDHREIPDWMDSLDLLFVEQGAAAWLSQQEQAMA